MRWTVERSASSRAVTVCGCGGRDDRSVMAGRMTGTSSYPQYSQGRTRKSAWRLPHKYPQEAQKKITGNSQAIQGNFNRVARRAINARPHVRLPLPLSGASAFRTGAAEFSPLAMFRPGRGMLQRTAQPRGSTLGGNCPRFIAVSMRTRNKKGCSYGAALPLPSRFRRQARGLPRRPAALPLNRSGSDRMTRCVRRGPHKRRGSRLPITATDNETLDHLLSVVDDGNNIAPCR